jgi:hypothetical protein
MEWLTFLRQAQTSLADILGDVQAALNSKNPQTKEGSLKFLGRCLSTTPTAISSAQIKPLSEQLAGLMEDQFEGARNEAAVCLGTLMKMVGERPLGAVMESLADVRKVKVKDAFEKATVKAKAGGPAKAASARAAPPSKPASTKPPSKPFGVAKDETPSAASGPAADESEDKPARKPPAKLLVCSCSVVVCAVFDIVSGEETRGGRGNGFRSRFRCSKEGSPCGRCFQGQSAAASRSRATGHLQVQAQSGGRGCSRG